MLETIAPRSFESQDVFRNIPTNSPSRHLFGDDLSDRELEIVHFWADSGSGIDQGMPQKDRWYDYNDPEDLSFCFEGTEIANSRYTDGSFPVWYGAIQSEEASRLEIIYHLKRQAKVDAVAGEEYICFQRAMCRAKIKDAQTVDLRGYLKDCYSLHDDPPYNESNKIGKQVLGLGHTGIIYPSKRMESASCIALFRKESILESRVINFFTVEVYEDRVTICGED